MLPAFNFKKNSFDLNPQQGSPGSPVGLRGFHHALGTPSNPSLIISV